MLWQAVRTSWRHPWPRISEICSTWNFENRYQSMLPTRLEQRADHELIPWSWHHVHFRQSQYGANLRSHYTSRGSWVDLRERERFNHMSIRPAWPMRTSHCSCLSQLKDGCQAIRNTLLVLVPHEGAHGTTTAVIQISVLSSDSIKTGVFKTEMALITNSSSIA